MIAIVVALAVSTFLLGFAALAVDLGSAYVRKAELQSVANRLALAGAKGLPDMTRTDGAIDQIDRTLQQICRSSPVPGVCTADNNAPDPGWMTDGDPGNGEVTFYSDTNGDTEYSLSDQVSDLAASDVATALRVKLAPSTVDFGLAGAIGTDSATLTKSASGRVGTPIGSGILPFALLPGDLTSGQFCVRDPAFPLNPTPPGPTPDLWPVNLTFPPDGAGETQYPGGVPPNTPDLTMRIRLTYPPTTRTPSRLSNVVFHFTNSLEQFPLTGTATRETGGSPGEDFFVITIPEGAPGTTAQVWATGQERIPRGGGRTVDFVSGPGTIFYSGALPSDADLCQQASSERGFIDLARPGSGEQLDNLENNIRSSTAVNLFPVDGLLGTVGSDLDCVSTSFSSSATTCLSLVTGTDFDDAFTDGFLQASGGTPGRLVGNCGNGQTSNNVDASRLFEDPGFIDTRKGGSAAALRNRLLGGASEPDPANRGWLTGHVLACPRLAVMPIVDPDSLIGTVNGKNITGFSYVWIDDDLTSTGRGLHFTRGQVDSFRGYVIDPGYLPATVAGSQLLGPYLGGDMPKQVRLIPDLGGSPT